jgi:hypothetical protein
MKTFQINNDSEKALNKLTSLIGPKLYSDKYSFINEIYQNAMDASRKCGTTKKIEMGMMGDHFYMRDYGCSFENKEEFEHYIGGITNSKKEGDDSQVGEYGIGSLSPSAYHSNSGYESKWYYKIFKAGKVFDATIRYDEQNGFQYTISDYSETKEDDGVLFKIPIYNKSKIREKVTEKLKGSTEYIWLEKEPTVSSIGYTIESIDKQIIDHKDYIITKDDEDRRYRGSGRNIIVDSYIYQCNESYDFPVYFKIHKKHVSIPATRESGTLKESGKTELEKKKKVFMQYINTEWNKQYPNTDFQDPVEYIKFEENNRGRIMTLNGNKYDVSKLRINNVVPLYKGKKIQSYDMISVLKKAHPNPRMYMSGKKIKYFYGNKITDVDFFILEKKRLPSHTLAYLKANHNTFIIVNKDATESNIMSDYVAQTGTNIEDIVVPDEYKTMTKRKPRPKKKSGEFAIEYVKTGRYTHTYIFDKQVATYDEIHKNPFLTIYSTEANIKEYGIYNEETIRFARVTEAVKKKLDEKNLKNWMSVDEDFYPYLRRKATSYMLKHELNKLTGYNTIDLHYYNQDLYVFINKAEKYINKHMTSYHRKRSEIAEYFEKHDCYDPSIYIEFLQLKKEIKYMSIVSKTVGINGKDEDVIAMTQAYLKQNNIRWKNFKK